MLCLLLLPFGFAALGGSPGPYETKSSYRVGLKKRVAPSLHVLKLPIGP